MLTIIAFVSLISLYPLCLITNNLGINNKLRISGLIILCASFLYLFLDIKLFEFNQFATFLYPQKQTFLILIIVYFVLIFILYFLLFLCSKVTKYKNFISGLVFFIFISIVSFFKIGPDIFYDYQYHKAIKLAESIIIPKIEKGESLEQIYNENKKELHYFNKMPSSVTMIKSEEYKKPLFSIIPKKENMSVISGRGNGYTIPNQYTFHIKFPSFACIYNFKNKWICDYKRSLAPKNNFIHFPL